MKYLPDNITKGFGSRRLGRQGCLDILIIKPELPAPCGYSDSDGEESALKTRIGYWMNLNFGIEMIISKFRYESCNELSTAGRFK